AAFSLSLLGTFIVRSGVLTSVHAFASDPERGLFILIFLGMVIGGSLTLYALRAPKETGKPSAPLSRETLLVVNNLLLSAAAAMVLIGTLSPLLFEALNLGKISVGPPYFGTLFLWLMLPIVLLIPFGPITRWQRESASMLTPVLRCGLIAVVIALAVAFAIGSSLPLKGYFGAAGAAWVLAGIGWFVVKRFRTAAPGKRFTAEMLGMTLAHAGLGVFVAGALI